MQPETNLPLDTRAPSPAACELTEQTLANDRCLLSVGGEVDLGSAPTLKLALEQVLADRGYRDIILDLSQLSFLDSTALAVLIGVRRRLEDGRRLVIANPTHEVLRLLTLTGLNSAFETFLTVEDACHFLEATDSSQSELPLSPDAAVVFGLATTALPFAASYTAEAQCWARLLLPSEHSVLAPEHPGSSQDPEQPPRELAATEPEPAGDRSAHRRRLDRVLAHAARIARQRGASAIRTGDVLRGVIAVYGAVFERALQACQ